MVICRLVSSSRPSIASLKGMLGRLPSRDTPEDAADRHAEPGHIAAPEDVARHCLAGREDARHYLIVVTQNLGLWRNTQAVIGEGDAGPERVGVVGRHVDA